MTFERRSVALGLRDSLPIAVAVVPFGAIVGLGAVQVGLAKLQAILMPYLVFAGASQLAAYQLVSVGAPVLVILATTTMINLRFTMYSAALARYLTDLPRFWRFFIVFFTTDQGFVLALHRFEAEDPPASKRDYLLASWLPLWFTWTTSAAAGALLGATVPPSWHLDFAVPLVFLALLAAALRDRPKLLAAVVGGTAAVVLAGLPLNLGMLLGSLAGIAAGTLVEGGSRRRYAPEADR
ncbi:MAG: AzlC family ABC transporter permease [Deinococcales bacterium]|jgi:4-azaleucine resistance transporter AzlC